MDSEEYLQNRLSNSRLLRFRSAPSSFLDNKDSGDQFESHSGLYQFGDKSPVTVTEVAVNYGNSQLPPHYPRHSSGMDGSYGVVNSMVMDDDGDDDDDHTQVKVGNGTSSNLVSQSSSPAGLFSHLNVQNGYAAMRGVGNFRVGSGTNGEVSPSTSRLKGRINFSSGVPSSLGLLSQISEIGSESIGASSPDDEKLRNGNGDARFYSPGFQFGSWNDSSHFTENFTGLKRDLDNDEKLYSGGQNGELGNRGYILSHHLSLPKTSAEMASVEKFLQFQDSVPCKIRAKRGFATHPRSIAERVRRTRISERMRKLQELVPNMDKQTNTADMLDLAVDYIKDLQKQFKTLSDNRENCKCLSMQKPVPNQTV